MSGSPAPARLSALQRYLHQRQAPSTPQRQQQQHPARRFKVKEPGPFRVKDPAGRPHPFRSKEDLNQITRSYSTRPAHTGTALDEEPFIMKTKKIIKQSPNTTRPTVVYVHTTVCTVYVLYAVVCLQSQASVTAALRLVLSSITLSAAHFNHLELK